jgi:ATP-dependent DNA helicase DinG
LQSEKYITWLEKTANENNSDVKIAEYKLCGTPKNLDKILFNEQWRKNIPTVFTSGTLSANGDFTRFKEQLGLNFSNSKQQSKLNFSNSKEQSEQNFSESKNQFSETKISENIYQSPFNYEQNCMLYVSETTENPNAEIHAYTKSISDEIERLVEISNGHAAILFTSYDVMGRVFSEIKSKKLGFPMFKLSKSTGNEISLFKKSKNGILFASGALWEGIDIPNDTLSMLIIVKLPFEKPNPISEYEQSKFMNFDDYREKVIVPEMLIKLKQGFGRLIRTESDTGIVALLDSRISENESYKSEIFSALPKCKIAKNLNDVNDFLREKKSEEYWNI